MFDEVLDLKPTVKPTTLHMMAFASTLRGDVARLRLREDLMAIFKMKSAGKIDVSIFGNFGSGTTGSSLFTADLLARDARANVSVKNVDIPPLGQKPRYESKGEFIHQVNSLLDDFKDFANLELYQEYSPYTDKNPLLIYFLDLLAVRSPIMNGFAVKLLKWLAEKPDLPVVLINRHMKFAAELGPEHLDYILNFTGTRDEELAEKLLLIRNSQLIHVTGRASAYLALKDLGIGKNEAFLFPPGGAALAERSVFTLSPARLRKEKAPPKADFVADFERRFAITKSEKLPRWLYVGNPQDAYTALFLLALDETPKSLLIATSGIDDAERKIAAGAGVTVVDDCFFENIRYSYKPDSTVEVFFTPDDVLYYSNGVLSVGSTAVWGLGLAASSMKDHVLLGEGAENADFAAFRAAAENITGPLFVPIDEVDIDAIRAQYFALYNESLSIVGKDPVSETAFGKLFEKRKLRDGAISIFDLDSASKMTLVARLDDKAFAKKIVGRNPEVKPVIKRLAKPQHLSAKTVKTLGKNLSGEKLAECWQHLVNSLGNFYERTPLETGNGIMPVVKTCANLSNIRLLS